MIALTELLANGLDEAELTAWVEEAWVHASGPKGQWQFEEIDVARIRLIRTLRDELEIGEPALPVVLSLLDQLYALRRQALKLNEALAALPEGMRAEVLLRLGN